MVVVVVAAFHFIAFLSYASSLQFIGKERAFLLCSSTKRAAVGTFRKIDSKKEIEN